MASWPTLQRNERDGYWWELVELSSSSKDALYSCAVELAESIANRRLPPGKYSLWHAIVSEERPPTTNEQRALRVYFDSDFGSPSAPPPPHRAEAAVAEALWHKCTTGRVEKDRRIEHIDGHSIDVTDHGGDGLVVYSGLEGLSFRLWEVKKHVSATPLRETVTGAHRQLDENALSYLARFSQACRQQAPHLAEFLERLVDLWIEHSESAGAGVAVAAETKVHDERAFAGLPNRFPKLKGRLEGIAHIFEDFPAFCKVVQEHLWKGL